MRGKCFAITGKCWCGQKQLAEAIKKAGGTVTVDEEVTRTTDVLVRGESGLWKHGIFGRKEENAAAFIREGQALVVVYDAEFRKLLVDGEPARCADYVAGERLEWLVPAPERAAYERAARLLGATDREQSVIARIEQRYLRKQLFRGGGLERCALCGRTFPEDLMIAAHIKPRSQCSTAERLDVPNIVFGLCLFGCDALYEKGFVAVVDGGRIMTRAAAGLPAALREQLRVLRGRRCPAWHEGTCKYFAWHYESHS